MDCLWCLALFFPVSISKKRRGGRQKKKKKKGREVEQALRQAANDLFVGTWDTPGLPAGKKRGGEKKRGGGPFDPESPVFFLGPVLGGNWEKGWYVSKI